MDMKDFLAAVGESDQRQTDQFCFKVAQSIFVAIDAHLKRDKSAREYSKVLGDRLAIMKFG